VAVESYWLAECNSRGQVEELLESNTDITQRKRLQEHLEEEVDARTAKVREAIAEVEHMSYSMVHDMRAPLRAMQSFAHILEEECPDCRHPPGSEYLGIIRQSSMRLDRLITDALTYSRVVSTEVPLAAVKIGPLLHGIIETYPNLQPRVADIVVDVGNVSVLANESLLTQCFGNLLDNAVKFVVAGVRPSVRIWAEEIGGLENSAGQAAVIRIWFEDNGVGIRKDAQERIFRMFQRMHAEGEFPGTGIGLTIVKKALERMNGQVGLESEVGKGSRFWVELPEAIVPEAEEQVHLAQVF
jgi:signal transduction histidine kinase